jgi:RHS repeat-associated protein
VLSPTGQTAWSYNAGGKVLTEQRSIGGVTKSIGYVYSANGSLAGIYYPEGTYSIGYGFDSADQTASVSDASLYFYAASSTFTPGGALSTVLLGENLAYGSGSTGDTVNYSYDVRFRPSETKAASQSSAQTLLDLSFSYFPNSNLQGVTNNLDNTRTVSYSYDNLNRISSGSSQATSGTNCWGQSFTYDRYANLTGIASTQCGSPTMSVSVNAKNQITNTGYSYDYAGNVTGDGTYTYTWDAENHLTSVNGVGYTYDGDGRRVKKSSGTLYWYGVSGEVLEETDLTGNLQNEYVYFRGRRVGKRDSTGAQYVYLADPLGSTRMITDWHGNVKNSSDYYPFGGERVIASSVTNNYKFTGLQRDSESGLDHTLFRQYSSIFGRWMSPDPVAIGCTNPQSLNRYAYVLNNPTTLADPLGLSAWSNCYWDTSTEPAKWVCPTMTGGGGEGGSASGPCSLVIRDEVHHPMVSNCPPGGGGGGGGGGSDSRSRAIDYFAKDKACQNFILQTIQKVFQAMDKGAPLSAAQQAADTASAFEGDLSRIQITQSTTPLPYGATAEAGLSGVTVGPGFSGLAAWQQSDVLIHETLHTAPAGGASYGFMDVALANAWGLQYQVVQGNGGQTAANASLAFETLLEDPKNCGPPQ